MNITQAPEFSREEVNRLAFLNWEKDGCPLHREVDYWLEAESQIKATWHLLVRELAPKSPRRKSAVAEKSKPQVAVKLFVHPKPA